jgi:hypothetical protein
VTIDEIASRLGDIGWLGYLSAAKRKRLTRDLREWSERDPAWTYLGLATSSYDIEGIEDDGDYADLVRTYREASHGVFDARDVESRLDVGREEAFVAFTLGGQRFEARFSMELGDYVSEDFEPFINRCLQQAGIEQRFYTLPMIDQIAHLVFVPPSVYAAAEAAGLLGTLPPPAARVRDSESQAPTRRSTGWGEGLPLPASPRAYVTVSATGAVLASLAGGLSPLLAALLVGVVAIGLGVLVMSLVVVQHPFGRLWLCQLGLFALTVANAGLLSVNLQHGSYLLVLMQLPVGAFTVWQGARVGSGGPVAAQRYTRSIRRYCAREGIEVPMAFGRHPALRFVVVRTDSSPQRLSTATLFDEADLHRYIQAKMRELDVCDGSALPLRVLDFENGQELAIGPTGETYPARRLVPPFPR